MQADTAALRALADAANAPARGYSEIQRFYMAARTAVPALCAEVDALRAELAAVKLERDGWHEIACRDSAALTAAQRELQQTNELLRDTVLMLGHLRGFAQRRFERFPDEREYLAEYLADAKDIIERTEAHLAGVKL